MVYSEQLGYDPDEWEECPPPDHFLVFSPFTRLVLSLSAIAFAAAFFWLIDKHNAKGSKREEEQPADQAQRTSASSSSSSPQAGDFLSVLTGFLTGANRAVDPDFVQRSFADAEHSPSAAAAAAKASDEAAKIHRRPDESSSPQFHYKSPQEPKTAADVRAELDQAAFELRDLLSEEAAPPVPPHRSDGFAQQLSSQLQEGATGAAAAAADSAHRVSHALSQHQQPSGFSEGLQNAYESAGQAAHDAYDRAAAPVADAFANVQQSAQSAYDQSEQAASDAYGRITAPVADAFGNVQQSARNAYESAGQAASDAYGRVAAPFSDAFGSAQNAAQDAYDRAGAAASNTFENVGQTASDAYNRAAAPVADAFGSAQEAAKHAYDRAAEPVTDVFGNVQHSAQNAYNQAGQTAHDAYDRVAAPVADSFDSAQRSAHDAYDKAAAPVADAFGNAQQSGQNAYNQPGQAASNAYDRVAAPVTAALDRSAAPDAFRDAQRAAQAAYERVADPLFASAASDAYDRVLAAGKEADADTASPRFEEDFERVQRDLDNLMAEHQAPLGVIIPGSSSSTTPAASHLQPAQQQHQGGSPIDEHVRQLTAGLLTSDSDQDRNRSGVPSLHDLYEERQRQLSPPLGSPVKIPTMEDRAALRHWEEDLARMEAEKVAKLGDVLVGGDDISDIASSGGTDHLLPADHISMYSQESGAGAPLAEEGTPIAQRRPDDPFHNRQLQQHPQEALPATAKINQKIDQISSALEQSLLSEIEQLARQTSTMQAELARARDSEYSTDDEALQQLQQHRQQQEERGDAFQPAGDVLRFVPAGGEQPAPISHRSSERQSGESDDFVKITPPSHSGAPSPSPAPAAMSSSEEEQLKRLVEEYDVIGSSSSTLKKDSTAPAALAALAPLSPNAAGAAAQPPLPSPTTAALLQEYETVPAQMQQMQQPQQQGSEGLSAFADSPLAAAAVPQLPSISAEEQAQLDQVLQDFELSPRLLKDPKGQLPRTPPQTPETTLLTDPFGRPIQGLGPAPSDSAPSTTTHLMFGGEPQSPSTEMTFPLAPRKSIAELTRTFPGLPTQASIEVVDPALAHLPQDAVLPADLEDVLASLVNVDTTALFLPSDSSLQQQQPTPAAAAAAHHQLQQGQHETPIMSGGTPDVAKKESTDSSVFGERKPSVIHVQPGSAAAAAVPDAGMQQQPQQQLMVKQGSLDLSHPLQPAMSAFDRPAPVTAASADFVLRQGGAGNEEEPYASFSMKPQMLPAFGGAENPQSSPPAAAASATIPHDELLRADAVFQDALDYIHAQKPAESKPSQQPHQLQHPTGFIMEEEMLSSHGENAPRPRPIEKSAEATSKLIRTNDVFDRQDTHDDHDDMTYAPEIQSVEIPPDQMSETSELPPHEDLPLDDLPSPLPAKSLQAQKLEAEIRAAESAVVDEQKNALQHRAALAQAPHIISMSNAGGGGKHPRFPSTPSISSAHGSPKALRKQSSLLSILGVTSTQEMLLKIDSLEALSNAMRMAGLDSTNVIFGIDYTASNKYQGEESFGGHSLHTIHPNLKNPYQQVITILGRTLTPFTSTGSIPVYGFGDARTSDWSVFPLKEGGHCTSLEEVLKTYNEVTPTVELSGPTNFSPLIYQAIEICQRTREYHILVIIADGQVTNEKATRRAIVQACQYPLSIIVVGVGDGPWEMMRVFDESLPKRPWDNFHFVEFHDVVKRASGAADGDVKIAIQSLLEIPDQYRCICNLGLLKGRSPSTSHKK